MSFIKRKLSIKGKPKSATMSPHSSTPASQIVTREPSPQSTAAYNTPRSQTPTPIPIHGNTTHTPLKHSNASSDKLTNSFESSQYSTESEVTSSSQKDIANQAKISENPLEQIALTSAILGVLFGVSISISLYSSKAAPIYIMALSLFHFLEYFITAKYNPINVHKGSFIINNGSAYTLAHTFALLEALVEHFFFPNFKNNFTGIKTIGFILIIIGQIIRTIAMKTAGQSFNHLVATKRTKEHVLVTDGIYSYLRHPSYFGFFWWAVGTQLILVNPISLIGFIIILWNFFSERIDYEEKFLVGFFGDRYTTYREKTPVYIPFIS